MGMTLGGAQHKARAKGDIVTAFHHVNEEPAMVIFPRRQRVGGGAFVVCLSSAYKYREDDYLIRMAFVAANTMGMHPDKSTVRRIADSIVEGLDDLVKMPPEAFTQKRDFEISMKGDQIRIEGEI